MADVADRTEEEPKEKKNVVARNAADLQRIRLEKLMKNPAKPVYIPDRPQEKKPKEPMEFVRNVWGSSAGAGSGEFHVYRGIRRREYARQKFLDEKTVKDQAEEEYHEKVCINQETAEAKTAKKRAKRLKKKQKQNAKKSKPNKETPETKDESESDDEENENVNGEANKKSEDT